jgi:DNA-binding transcriptional ArsR family regulator
MEAVNQILVEMDGAGDSKSPVQEAPPVIPLEVPHYKSFDHIEDARMRRAKEYEQYLLFALTKFPEYADRIHIEIKFAQTESMRSTESDQDRILSAFNGWDELLCQEIADDLKLNYRTVHKHLKRMLETGLVQARQRTGVSGNKPMIVYSIPPNS